jgi:uncharacterized protein YecE (DUF72 family)
MPIDLPNYRARLASLAADGIFIGTSSWKYAEWCGQVYSQDRYITNKKFSQAKFERTCLADYAETFSTVCVDAGYYQFPTEKYLTDLCAAVPDGFRFAFKVTDDITIKKFPSIARFGIKAGTFNADFLNPELFRERFLTPCSVFREKIGPLIFEFSEFKKHEFEHGNEFVVALDAFFSMLPKGWEYGVEIRNKSWLVPEYFTMLRSHGVAHVFNNWSRMPPIAEQIELPECETAEFSVSRFLLKPGRIYEQAVNEFSPYTETKEVNEEARVAGKQLIKGALQKRRRCYIYVNNRLEGNAPLTIDAIIPDSEPSAALPPALRETLF